MLKKPTIFLLSTVCLLQAAQVPASFPKPDYANAIDAIFQPKYRSTFDRMFPHLDFDAQPRAKIINGQPAAVGQFPYQVLKYMTPDGRNWYTCGGSLIRRDWVMTAGHCTFGFISFDLLFGIIQRPPSDYTWATSITGSQYIHLHERYDDDTLANDIALIFLSDAPSDLLQMPNIGLAELPKANDGEVNLVGVTATVSGFGKTADGGLPSNQLMFTTAPVMSNAQCAETFGPFVLSTNICLNTVGAGSSCSGDSGGPLTAEIETGRRVQIGIVSFGAAVGCELGHPAVFTRVTAYVDWIGNVVNPQAPPSGNDCNCVCNCYTCPALI